MRRSTHDTFDESKQNNKSLKISILRAIGIFCMVFCVIDWVVLSLFLQKVETSDYDKPNFIRYCVNSSYILAFIPWYIMKRIYDHKYGQNQKPSDIKLYRSLKEEPLLINQSESMNRMSANSNTIDNSLSLSLINDSKHDANPNKSEKQNYLNLNHN